LYGQFISGLPSLGGAEYSEASWGDSVTYSEEGNPNPNRRINVDRFPNPVG